MTGKGRMEEDAVYRVERPLVTPAEMRILEHLRRVRERSRGRQALVILELVNGVVKISDAAPKGVVRLS